MYDFSDVPEKVTVEILGEYATVPVSKEDIEDITTDLLKCNGIITMEDLYDALLEYLYSEVNDVLNVQVDSFVEQMTKNWEEVK